MLRFTLVFACGLVAGCVTPSSSMLVAVPVADVRAQPGSSLSPGLHHDPLQETQLLYGERVRVRARRDGWALVEAVEQQEHTHHHRWEGYPGWVREEALRSADRPAPNAIVAIRWATVWDNALAGGAPLMQLPMGTSLLAQDGPGAMQQVRLVDGQSGWISPGDVHLVRDLTHLPTEQQRQLILRAADQLLGDGYVWGGRSPAPPLVPSPLATTAPWNGAATSGGVDCSGLVNLAYRTAGLTIPRDAHEQYLRARPVRGASKTPRLKPADLLFLSAPDDPNTIVHVMLYAGDGWLIEGPGTGQAIRRITVRDRLGLSPERLADGRLLPRASGLPPVAGEQTLYLGTFLPD